MNIEFVLNHCSARNTHTRISFDVMRTHPPAGARRYVGYAVLEVNQDGGQSWKYWNEGALIAICDTQDALRGDIINHLVAVTG